MRRLIPSPALIVACLALLLCSGGAAYAAVKIGTKDIAKGAVTSRKIRDGTVRPADLNPATLARMGARAYGSVTVDMKDPAAVSFDDARTSGFATVTRPQTGVYCLTLHDDTIDPATLAPVVGVEWDKSAGANLAAYLSKSAHQCPAGTDVGVRTFSFTAGKGYRPADTVAFTVLVP